MQPLMSASSTKYPTPILERSELFDGITIVAERNTTMMNSNFFEGALEKVMYAIRMFDRVSVFSMEGFEDFGAYVLA